eukprot:PLAT9047.1.p1 GENE.PLAT9047.1~~PLAT9047.1.p1  ORF type:complete len:464 (+),score=191.99 PLAT9047.1:48-1439(+)
MDLAERLASSLLGDGPGLVKGLRVTQFFLSKGIAETPEEAGRIGQDLLARGVMRPAERGQGDFRGLDEEYWFTSRGRGASADGSAAGGAAPRGGSGDGAAAGGAAGGAAGEGATVSREEVDSAGWPLAMSLLRASCAEEGTITANAVTAVSCAARWLRRSGCAVLHEQTDLLPSVATLLSRCPRVDEARGGRLAMDGLAILLQAVEAVEWGAALCAAGACTAAVQLMAMPSAATVSTACQLLALLARERVGASTVLTAMSGDLLKKQLASPDRRVAYAAGMLCCQAVDTLLAGSVDDRQLRDSGWLPALVSLLSSRSKRLFRHACQLLLALSTSVDNLQPLLAAKPMPLLVARIPRCQPAMRLPLCRLAANLAALDSGCSQWVRSGGLALLSKLLLPGAAGGDSASELYACLTELLWRLACCPRLASRMPQPEPATTTEQLVRLFQQYLKDSMASADGDGDAT